LGVETDVVRCRHCGAVYAWPTLLPLINPYAEEDAANFFKIHDENRKVELGRELAAFAERVLQRPGSMLEIGCGRGELLAGARERGWTCRGVEMTPQYAAIAAKRGISVEVASAETCRSLWAGGVGDYDVVLTAAVLEHLYDPMVILERIHHVLRPGGLLFIDVPNEASLAMRVGNLYQRLQLRNWTINLSPTFPPFHVVGFSPKTLRYALNRLGFTLYKLDVVRYSNDVPDNPTLKRKLERLAMSVVQHAGHRIGMGDGLICWARKPLLAEQRSVEATAAAATRGE
jgi:SAM-dependent methyltransferase